MPKLAQTVKRMPDMHNALAKALVIYWEKFNAGWARLTDANGGEEPYIDAEFFTTQGPDGEIIRTLKNLGPDPIGDILEGKYT